MQRKSRPKKKKAPQKSFALSRKKVTSRFSKPSFQPSPKKEVSTRQAFRRQEVTPVEELIARELPFSYGETKMVLLVRDPYWAYSCWDFSAETWNWIQKKLNEDPALKPMIRVYELDVKRQYSLLVSLEAKNWYIHLGTPDRCYAAELGLGDGERRFFLIVRSNEIRTPRDSPSDLIDPEWSGLDFDEIYRLSGGGQTGLSSPGSLFFPRQVEG